MVEGGHLDQVIAEQGVVVTQFIINGPGQDHIRIAELFHGLIIGPGHLEQGLV